MLVPTLVLLATTLPYPGIEHRTEEQGGQRWHIVSIELGRPSISIHASREEERGKTLSQIAKAHRAVVAVNANIFRSGFSLCGTAMANGTPWTKVDDSSCVHGFGWGIAPSTFGLVSIKDKLAPEIRDVVSGYPTLVRGGVLCDGSSPTVCSIPVGASAAFSGPNPRTIVGVDQNKTHLLLGVVDGREFGAASGMTLAQAAKFARETMGAFDAVNLDGGGSSELFLLREGGIVNVPSDGSERAIASAIVVSVDSSKEVGGPPAAAPPEVEERGQRRRYKGSGTVAVVVFAATLLGWVVLKIATKLRRDP
ncbi:MAG: phosphodiester glycosidase family protein [Polyangiales bacterium]